MGKNVLIVSTIEYPDEVLRGHVDEADTIKVVAPVVQVGILDWLANDEAAFDQAGRVADRTAEELPGHTTAAQVDEADVGLAIRDALATFAADEILVALRPGEEDGRVDASSDGLPVRHVVIPD
jgi:hypothetical protein